MGDESQRLADGRYELFEAIGSGGMATVYRAQDHRLGVARAIKVLLPAYASKDRVRARFEAEARTMAILDHPNIVRVYDVGATTETAWIVMELVEGSSMLTHIGDFGMGIEDCLNVGAKILAALEVAHHHGIVHRDIKPHNVLMSNDGIVRITDFGIARSAGLTEDSLTKTGTVMGTWAFMAPEQRVNAKSVDHTADIYGAGATLFAMATGQTPMDLFAADLDPDMMAKVPAPLVPLIRQATRYNREERYPTARAMLDAVEALREEMGIQTLPLTTIPARTGPSEPTSTAPQSPPVETPVLAPSDAPTIDASPKGVPASITYVDTDPLVPSPDETRSDPHSTAVPYRPPQPSVGTNASSAEMEGAGRLNSRIRERSAAALAVLLIAGLAYGGFVKRAQSPALPQDNATRNDATATPPSVPPLDTLEASSSTTMAPMDSIGAAPAPEASEARPAPIQTAGDGPEPVPPTPASEPPSAPLETADAPSANAPEADAQSGAARETSPASDDANTAPAAAVGPPELEHAPPRMARMNSRLPLSVQIANLSPLEIQTYGVRVYYRASGTAKYSTATLSRTRRTWSGSIPVGANMEAGVEYFIKASSSDTESNRLVPLKSGRNSAPHRVRVSSP